MPMFERLHGSGHPCRSWFAVTLRRGHRVPARGLPRRGRMTGAELTEADPNVLDDGSCASCIALRQIIRGVIEASRPGTSRETLSAAWKAAGTAIAIDDARSDPEFAKRLEDVRERHSFNDLAHHHREAEMLGERMRGLLLNLLPLYDNYDLRIEIEEAIKAWDAHQWPDFDKEN